MVPFFLDFIMLTYSVFSNTYVYIYIRLSQHLNPAVRCARMGALAHLPVSRLIRAVNDFDLPGQVRYAKVSSKWMSVVKATDYILSFFINTMTLFTSWTFDNIAMYVYTAYLLSILLCILITVLTWYYIATAVALVAVAATLLAALSKGYSRSLRTGAYMQSSKVVPYSDNESNEGDEPGLLSDDHSEIGIIPLHNEEQADGSSCSQSAEAGSRDPNSVEIIGASAETIYYSDGQLGEKSSTLQPTLPPGPTNNFAAQSSARHYVEIMDSSTADIIYSSNGNSTSSVAYTRAVPKHPRRQLPPVQLKRRHLVEIVRASGVEEIIASTDIRRETSPDAAYGYTYLVPLEENLSREDTDEVSGIFPPSNKQQGDEEVSSSEKIGGDSSSNDIMRDMVSVATTSQRGDRDAESNTLGYIGGDADSNNGNESNGKSITGMESEAEYRYVESSIADVADPPIDGDLGNTSSYKTANAYGMVTVQTDNGYHPNRSSSVMLPQGSVGDTSRNLSQFQRGKKRLNMIHLPVMSRGPGRQQEDQVELPFILSPEIQNDMMALLSPGLFTLNLQPKKPVEVRLGPGSQLFSAENDSNLSFSLLMMSQHDHMMMESFFLC